MQNKENHSIIEKQKSGGTTMRYEEIIVLIVVVVIVSWIYDIKRNQKIKKGVKFCEKVENLLKAYQEIFGVEVGNITYKYEAQADHYIIAYDPKRPKSFFMQLELGIADALDEFDKIKNCEYDYVEEDWNCIIEHYNGLKELENHIRYETWRRGFRKV